MGWKPFKHGFKGLKKLKLRKVLGSSIGKKLLGKLPIAGDLINSEIAKANKKGSKKWRASNNKLKKAGMKRIVIRPKP